MTKSARLGAGIVFGLVILCLWYSRAADYDYGALAGTYVLSSNGETCALYLRPDRTFSQELTRAGVAESAHGTWHRYGEAHVSFSKEFIKLSGEELNAAGQAHGQFDKLLGLLPSLTLAPLPDGPKLHKKFF
jgi:hypothetical protein